MPASANCSGNLGESSQLATKAIVPSSGCAILSFKDIQAVALASTNEYLCECILCSIFSVSGISSGSV